MKPLSMLSEDEWCLRADRLASEFSSGLMALTDDFTCRHRGNTAPDRRGTRGRSQHADRVRRRQRSRDLPLGGRRRAGDRCHAHASRLTWLLDRIGTDDEAVVLDRIPEGLPHRRGDPGPAGTSARCRREVGGADPDPIGGRRVCALAVEAVRAGRQWPPALVARLRLVAEILASALYRSRQEEALRYRSGRGRAVDRGTRD